MNTTQDKFESKTFESNEFNIPIDGELHSIELEPE